MEILRQDDGKKGSFYVEESGERLAEMTYVHAPNGILPVWRCRSAT